MPRMIPDFTQRLSQTRAWEMRRSNIERTAASVTPAHASVMARFANIAPFVDPGIVRALSQAGIQPESPVARYAIAAQLERNFETTGSYDGQPRTNRNRPRNLSPQERAQQHVDALSNMQAQDAEQEDESLARSLIRAAEQQGVFDRQTGLLIEPAANDSEDVDTSPEAIHEFHRRYEEENPRPTDNPNDPRYQEWYTARDQATTAELIPLTDPQRTFTSLLGVLNRISGDAVPYVEGGTGRLVSHNPAGNQIAPAQIDPATGEPLTHGQTFEQGQQTAALIAQLSANADESGQARGGIEDTLSAGLERGTGDSLQAPNMANTGDPFAFIKPAVRATAMAFEAPIQELQGLVRNYYDAAHGGSEGPLAIPSESQSDLGIVVPRLIRNVQRTVGLNDSEFESIGLGNGMFVDPESEVAQERRAREASRGQINGQNVTLGRWIASSVTEPDTTPYRITSGLIDLGAQAADPTAYALGPGRFGGARLAQTLRTFQPDEVANGAGIFNGVRRYFHGPTWEGWANSHPQIFDRLAETSDAYAIDRATNFQFGPEISGTLARIPDATNARNYLRGRVERGQIRKTTELRPLAAQRSRQAVQDAFNETWTRGRQVLNPNYQSRPIRLLGRFPNGMINLNDPQQAATQLRHAMVNAHVPEEEIARTYNRIARSASDQGTPTKPTIRAAIGEAQSSVRTQLEGQRGILGYHGIQDEETLEYLTRVNTDTYQEDLQGLLDEVSSDTPTWEDIAVNGEPVRVSSPHLPLEYLPNYVHLPDQRAIRRLTSRYGGIFGTRSSETPVIRKPRNPGDPRLPLAAMDFAMSEVLKPMWLMRLAWPIRVIGEEQLRMGAANLDSAFSGHPMSWLAIATGRRNNVSPSGNPMDELAELQEVTYNVHGGWIDQPGVIRSGIPAIYTRRNPAQINDFRRTWASEIAELHKNPISNAVLNSADDPLDVVRRLHYGDLREVRRRTMQMYPGMLLNEDQTRRYVETITDHITRLTGNNTDVLRIMRDGTFGPNADNIIRNTQGHLNPNFSRYLDRYTDDAPQALVGRAAQVLPREQMSTYDRALDTMFYALMGKPTSVLSRSPAFKQYVWRHAADLIPFADEPAQARILASAREANVSRRQLKNLEHQAQRATGRLSAEEVDLLARGHALDDTKGLLYDLSEKGQASDILRNIFPFGEAWREVITRWADLAFIKGPGGIPIPNKAARRAQQVIEGARGEDFGEVMGAPDGQGFFWKNEFGEEVFAYPGSQWLMGQDFGPLPGAPVPLVGRVQGLNMFGSVMPSLGPVAQIPIAHILANKPNLDEWRDILLPFGGPGADETKDIFELRSYFPSWLQRGVDWLTKGGTDERIYGSSVMYMMAYLDSTGDFDHTVEGRQELQEEAESKVRDLYLVRTFGAMVLPANPSPRWLIEDKSGELVSQLLLAQQFYEKVDELGNDFQGATEWFLDEYGDQAIGAITPHSDAVIPGVPTSIEGASWVAEHTDVKEAFPLTYGFFAPTGELDPQIYLRSFMSGERDTITPKEWLQLHDTMIGNYHYQRARDELGPDEASPSREQGDWLRDVRQNIQDQYPYYGRVEGLAQAPELEHQIEELYRAIENPVIRNTRAGEALEMYLGARNEVMATIEAADLSPSSLARAERTAGSREWLAEIGRNLVDDYSEFQGLWDMVLSRELGSAPEELRESEEE